MLCSWEAFPTLWGCPTVQRLSVYGLTVHSVVWKLPKTPRWMIAAILEYEFQGSLTIWDQGETLEPKCGRLHFPRMAIPVSSINMLFFQDNLGTLPSDSGVCVLSPWPWAELHNPESILCDFWGYITWDDIAFVWLTRLIFLFCALPLFLPISRCLFSEPSCHVVRKHRPQGENAHESSSSQLLSDPY